MTTLPHTAHHQPFSGLSGRSSSAGVRAVVAFGIVALAVVAWSASGGHLEAVRIPASLVVFLTMALMALGGAVFLHRVQDRTHGGPRRTS